MNVGWKWQYITLHPTVPGHTVSLLPPLTIVALQDNFIKKRNSTIEAVIDLQRNYNNTVISSEIKFFLEIMPLQSCSNAEDALKFTFFKILF